MNLRMGTALLSLAGVFVSGYLWFYKIGLIGTLACGTGGCATVQLSPYSSFLGVDVGLIGLLGYLVILTIAVASLQPRWAEARWPRLALVGLSSGAVLFTGYLKYLEFFVIEAICRWCVVSAGLIAGIFILSLLDVRRSPQTP